MSVRFPSVTPSVAHRTETPSTPSPTAPQRNEVRGGTQDDTVAIIDHFEEPKDSAAFSLAGPPEMQGQLKGPPLHGKMVEHVLRKTDASLEESLIRRIDNSSHDVSEPEEFDKRIELAAVDALDSTTKSLQSVLDNPGRIKVINQSQAMSELRLVDNVLKARKDNPKELTDMLGLPENASRKEILTALVKRADQVFESSPAIREAKQRHAEVSAKLEKQDILHVITTGNERELVEEMDKLGVPYDEDFTQSLLATPNTISVAASTGGAKNQERIASFSTPTKDATLAIDGTQIEVAPGLKDDGTSFAAPQVTALIAQMRKMDPSLTNSDVRDILKRSSRDTAAPANLEGAGILDPQKALKLTRERMQKSIPRPISS